MVDKKTKRIGIVSYNIHYKYSNYGSVLQSYALQEALKLYTECTPLVIDYCPDNFLECDPLNPLNITENIEQAIERAGTKAGNKGYDCAVSAIEMINLIKEIEN